MRVLNKQEWYHIRDCAAQAGASLVQYRGDYYHVSSKTYPTGDSPLWDVTQVYPIEAPEITEWWDDE